MFEYKAMSFDAWLEEIHHKTNHENDLLSVNLYELSQNWLRVTSQFMVREPAEVVVHCLYETSIDDNGVETFPKNDSALKPQSNKLPYIALPLIHQEKKGARVLASLTSFYSSVTDYYVNEVINEAMTQKVLHQLMTNIDKRYSWHEMLLGPLDQDSQLLVESRQYFYHQKVVKSSANFYENNIMSFADYYESRPSQLKNTIKRREKKLGKENTYRIEVIDNKAIFEQYFQSYQTIYQLSWKGEEYSFDFIESVCRDAIKSDSLRMGILLINNVPVAAQIWFVHQRCASIFKLAYDPNYQVYSVGSILSLALSKYVIEVDKVTMIEFGMGNEPYKKDWMSKQRQRLSLQIFNHRSLRGNVMALKAFVIDPIINRLT